jgi:outer membrane protein OmpA-like peptidoglycan-associated protein
MSMRSLAPTVLAAAALLLACAKPAADPRSAIQVQVTSTPGASTLFLAGRPLGETPRTLTVPSLDALLELTATAGKEEVVEKRIRFLSQDRAEVAFIFGAGRSETAKALGLARILVFDYGAGVTFELNKSDLKPDFLPLLDRQAALLKKHFPTLDVFVCGHTDNLGTQEFNLTLSLARAKAVAANLDGQGVPRERLKVQGFGSAYPVAPNLHEAGRAQNRRTELVLPQ